MRLNGNPPSVPELGKILRPIAWIASLALQLPAAAALYQCPAQGGLSGSVRNAPEPGCVLLVARDSSGLNIQPVFIVPNYSHPLPPPETLRIRLRPELQALLEREALTATVPPDLIYLVIQQESRFNHLAVSARGALGLMQLMPDTAHQLGVGNPWDPAQNLRGGIRYLGQMIRQFAGNLPLAVAAYNAGPKAVENAGQRVPRFGETRDYVRQIFHRYDNGRLLANAMSLMDGGSPPDSARHAPAKAAKGSPQPAANRPAASPLYRWLDDAGQEHVTNFKPARGKIIGVINP
jgi:hypothetical protein